MAALDAALEAQPRRHAGDLDQRLGAQIAAFVDMQVEVEAAILGQREDAVEQLGGIPAAAPRARRRSGG